MKAICRTAEQNDGVPLGQKTFEKATGISLHKWRGKFWLRWSEAVLEAGYTPGRMNQAVPKEIALSKLAELTRKVAHFPTYAELLFERKNDKSFPYEKVYDRFGNRDERIETLREFAAQNTRYADILELLPLCERLDPDAATSPVDSEVLSDGYVYMFKLGKHYKIGRTFAVPRRHRQISLELREKPDVVHYIRTDDPNGIEAYWHKRFAHKQTNGEWFSLDAEDVRAFKRRKFM